MTQSIKDYRSITYICYTAAQLAERFKELTPKDTVPYCCEYKQKVYSGLINRRYTGKAY